MKKEYQKPEYEIILLNGKSVLTVSGGHWLGPEVPAKSVWSDD